MDEVATEHDIALIIVGIIYFIDFIIRIWLLIYIPKNRKPTAATSWLLLIYIIPLFGTILFFILGSTKLSKKRSTWQSFLDSIARLTSALQ